MARKRDSNEQPLDPLDPENTENTEQPRDHGDTPKRPLNKRGRPRDQRDNIDDVDDVDDDPLADALAQFVAETDATADSPIAAESESDPTGDDEHVDQRNDEHEEQPAAVPPTEADLASRGFTPDEVSRLVIVSNRQAQSDESQIAEATLRRLRFTRWLIEHGMLDEWSA